MRGGERLASALLGRSRSWRYAVAVVAVAIAYFTRASLAGSLGDRSPFQTFVIAVLVSAIAGGLGPGLFATLLGGVLVAYTYLPPSSVLAISAPADLIRLGLFGVEGLLSAAAGGIVHRALRREQLVLRSLGSLARLIRPGSDVAPSSERPTYVEPLSERELEIAYLLASGMRNDEIAQRLFVSRNTVKTHLSHAYAKLGVRTRTEAVARCRDLGLFEGLAGASTQAARVPPLGTATREAPPVGDGGVAAPGPPGLGILPQVPLTPTAAPGHLPPDRVDSRA